MSAETQSGYWTDHDLSSVSQDLCGFITRISNARPPSGNLLAHFAGDRTQPIFSKVMLRRPSDKYADVRVFSSKGETPELSDSIRSIASATPTSNGWTIRIDDDVISAIGNRLQEGRLDDLDTAQVLQGERVCVGFLDPNASKALHIGHLRSAVIGNALAGVLQGLGAHASRICFVGDVGRHMNEAMAGFSESTNGSLQIPVGEKADHFIGRAYSDYVKGIAPGRSSTDRDCADFHDVAAQLGDALAKDDELAVLLWSKTKTLVLAAQRQTLLRLGIHFDKFYEESEFLRFVDDFLLVGVRQGLWQREPTGAIAYRSKRNDAPVLLLARGFKSPTEHARLLTLFANMLITRRSDEYLYMLAGSEWEKHNKLHYEILNKLGQKALNNRVIQLYFEMVEHRGSTMKSSDGETLLIDDCLDRILTNDKVSKIRDFSENSIPRSGIAAVILCGYLLSIKATKRVQFDFKRVLDENCNPMWHLVSLACQFSSCRDGQSDGDPGDPLYRFGVIAAHDYWRKTVQAAYHSAPEILLNYLISYSKAFPINGQGLDRPLGMVISRVLKLGLGRLGLELNR